MPKTRDFTGKIFNNLTIVSMAPPKIRTSGAKRLMCNCVCICGESKIIQFDNLQSGHTKSCGCLMIETNTTHGMTGSPEHDVWRQMKNRCKNKSHTSYHRYGGRGISICERWHKFESFFKDMRRKPTPEHSIDRIDNDKGYFPENCRWATRTEQSRNKSMSQFNKSGVCGVYKHKCGKWAASIGVNRKNIHIGLFKDIADAEKARKEAEAKYWEPSV